MQRGAGKGRVGGGKQGRRSLNDQGTGPVRKEPSQSPSALLPALSHGVLEKGAGWPDWLACPWGQREGPRPARGAARPSPPWPSPSPPRVPGQGMSCSRRSLPGARGQGGLGGVLPSSPPHLFPAQVRAGAATTAAAPDSRRPRAGAAQGVGRGEGLGVPCGERASRRHLVAMPRAGERPRRPLGLCHLNHPAEELGPLAKEGTQILGAAGKAGCGAVGKGPFSQSSASQAPFRSGRIIPSLF